MTIVGTGKIERVTLMANPTPQRLHKATWARDKKKGGYLVRIIGPNAGEFAGREVPVTRMNDTESTEKLKGLIWTGIDEDSGRPVALYSVEARPREATADDLPF
jgi:hypothetical protein